jgi:hypothetical protein
MSSRNFGSSLGAISRPIHRTPHWLKSSLLHHHLCGLLLLVIDFLPFNTCTTPGFLESRLSKTFKNTAAKLIHTTLSDQSRWSLDIVDTLKEANSLTTWRVLPSPALALLESMLVFLCAGQLVLPRAHHQRRITPYTFHSSPPRSEHP